MLCKSQIERECIVLHTCVVQSCSLTKDQRKHVTRELWWKISTRNISIQMMFWYVLHVEYATGSSAAHAKVWSDWRHLTAEAPDGISDALQIPGIIVFSVVANSPAEQAGVRPMLNGTIGDVITTLDEKPIRSGSDIFKLLDKHAPGLLGSGERHRRP